MTKRKATRVMFKTEGVISHDDLFIKGQVENLSLRGMFLKTSGEIPLNSSIEIQIFLSGTVSELSIKLKGMVIRLEKKGMAVKFDEMELDSFIHLKNIVAYNEGNADKIMQEFHDYIKTN